MIAMTRLLKRVSRLFASSSRAQAGKTSLEIERSAEEWRRMLTANQYHVLREHGTERPWTSPLLKEDGVGSFRCAGCGAALYGSNAKFDSGTGWPSFTAPLGDGVETATDRSMFMARTEVHCRKCGGHLGHRFADGRAPTGMRHCINGAALTFQADQPAGQSDDPFAGNTALFAQK